MISKSEMTRRGFMKIAGITAGYAVLGFNFTREAAAQVLDFIGLRQASVYKADKEVYKIRKSQDNPMVKKLYEKKVGFLWDGPCGHNAHHFLHTKYSDKSARIAALKEEGIELSL